MYTTYSSPVLSFFYILIDNQILSSFDMKEDDMKGVVNAVAPFMVRVKEFYDCLIEKGEIRFFMKQIL